MREITSHKINGCNDKIKVLVTDEPCAGGANHTYYASWPWPAAGDQENILIHFQDGPIGEVGTNGITHEVLLAMVIDRLQSFQKGPFPCRENEIALTKLEEAMMWLQKRTLARVARGVEGTHKEESHA